nr:hypothetical protein [Arthrobacter sp. ERGS1:01]
MSALEPGIRHHQLIITLYGLYCRGVGQAMPVSVLIDMLGDLGYDGAGVRSAVSRLKAKGVLRSVKDGNVAQYELSSAVADLFAEGDERIFSDGTRMSPMVGRWPFSRFPRPCVVAAINCARYCLGSALGRWLRVSESPRNPLWSGPKSGFKHWSLISSSTFFGATT